MCYQHGVDCIYWSVLFSFNNWNIIQFINKTTSIEDFGTVHELVLDGISENMASLVQLGKYRSIYAAYLTTMGYYVIKYRYEPYTLQEEQTTHGQVSKAGELVVKSEYLSLMKEKRNCYWQ